MSLYDIKSPQLADSPSSVAKDRSWFVEYTPFETELGDIYREMAQPIRVMGIGTVELFTDPPPYSQERDLPRPLRLTNVLHAPSVVCNVVGWPILEDYNVVSDFGGSVTRGYIAEKEGRHIAYFDPRCNLLQVKLRDSLIGTHSLMRGGPYLINAQWPDTERAKWHAHQNNIGGLLTTEEKMWLKKHYGNEFRFLRNFGLSIYKEEDREYGRTLLRAFMEEEKTRSGA